MKLRLASRMVVFWAVAMQADDGLWLFNQFPSGAVKEKYEFDVTPAFLDHLRLSTARLPGGSGAFVSPNGLLVTNWHLVAGCVPQSGTDAPFYAATQDREVRCPGMEADVLAGMEDVTSSVRVTGKDGATSTQALSARNASMERIERECASKTGNVCEVVNLYSGGRYQLYRYRRYRDLRLVFAPERQLAFFGRERDSITYLRYGLDAAFLRAYENDRPAARPEYLKWSGDTVKDGDLVFAAGNPASTSRSTTVAQLTFYRDIALPAALERTGSRIKPLNKFAAQSEQSKSAAEPVSKGLLALYKSDAGKLIGLKDQRLLIRKALFEQKIRNAVERDPKLGTEGGKVWDQVAAAYKTWGPLEKQYQILEESPALGSTLFRIAKRLIEGQSLGDDADVQVNEGLEIAMLTVYLEELKSLGEKDAPVKAILGNKPADQAAEAIVKSSKLADIAIRKRYAADRASIASSQDGMLHLARMLEDHASKIRNKRQELIGTLEVSAAAKIAGYRLQLFGAADYPEANDTPRVSYGVVKGYTDRAGVAAPYAATFSGLFYRRNNEGPYMAPKNWVDMKSSLNPVTPLDFVSTCDIGGGDYGAPTVNKAGELTGMVFDGNLESLPAIYLYTDEQARAVHVAAQGMAEALAKVYKATGLLQELGVKTTLTRPAS